MPWHTSRYKCSLFLLSTFVAAGLGAPRHPGTGHHGFRTTERTPDAGVLRRRAAAARTTTDNQLEVRTLTTLSSHFFMWQI